MIDGAKHQNAGDPDGADRRDLVRQENPQMNPEHVSPPINCFRSCAGMHVNIGPVSCPLTLNANAIAPFTDTAERVGAQNWSTILIVNRCG